MNKPHENTDANDIEHAWKKLNTKGREIAERWRQQMQEEEQIELTHKWERAKDALMIEENPDIYGDGCLKIIEDALSNLMNDRHARGDLLAVARTWDDKDIAKITKHNASAANNKVHFTHLLYLTRTNDAGYRNQLLKQIMDPKVALSCQATLTLIRDHNVKVNPPKAERPTQRAKQIDSKGLNLVQTLEFDSATLSDSISRVKTGDLPKTLSHLESAQQTISTVLSKAPETLAALSNCIEEVQLRLKKEAAKQDLKAEAISAEDQSSAPTSNSRSASNKKKKRATVVEETPAGGPSGSSSKAVADIKKRLKKVKKTGA